ncbi:MAG: phospholipid carrier-dependent glycosyltransferase [Microbacteriaceae bacterium]|nr:phospholipid carrier-dependent glycosyltransferase [Microbacteriaceae bacterium]
MIDRIWKRMSTRLTQTRILLVSLLTLLAGTLRIAGLGYPNRLMFDETYYVKDAYTQWILGYASKWPSGYNDSWNAGILDGFFTDPSYIAHPPMGKWMIGAGMAVFGADNSFGWRIAGAVAGTLIIPLIFVIALLITKSTIVATLAGYMLAIDGNAIVMSRIALLDIHLAFLLVLATLTLLMDTKHRTKKWRPWLLATGVILGLACSVKWSAIWFVAAFGIWVVVRDWEALKLSAKRFWLLKGLGLGAINFVYMVVFAALAYLSTWLGWFLSDSGWNRQWSVNNGGPDGIAGAFLSLLHYHQSILNWHVSLDSHHSSMAPAWTWPLLLRPSIMYVDRPAECANECIGFISNLPNPLLWYAAIAAIIALLWMLMRGTFRGNYWLVLVAFGAGFVPWLLFPERTTFFFYTIAFQPFLYLALAIVIKRIIGRASDSIYRRQPALLGLGMFLGLASALSVFWYPLWTGWEIHRIFWSIHQWLPGWTNDIFPVVAS